jgi:hypothetical protein
MRLSFGQKVDGIVVSCLSFFKLFLAVTSHFAWFYLMELIWIWLFIICYCVVFNIFVSADQEYYDVAFGSFHL